MSGEVIVASAVTAVDGRSLKTKLLGVRSLVGKAPNDIQLQEYFQGVVLLMALGNKMA